MSTSDLCVTSCHRKQAEWISGKVGAGNVCGVWAFLPLADEAGLAILEIIILIIFMIFIVKYAISVSIIQ